MINVRVDAGLIKRALDITPHAAYAKRILIEGLLKAYLAKEERYDPLNEAKIYLQSVEQKAEERRVWQKKYRTFLG